MRLQERSRSILQSQSTIVAGPDLRAAESVVRGGKDIPAGSEERPNSWVTYNELGSFLQEQGRFQEAIQAFREASSAAPASALGAVRPRHRIPTDRRLRCGHRKFEKEPDFGSQP